LRPGWSSGVFVFVQEAGKPIVEVARDLGINPGTLANWVKRDREESKPADAGLAESERDELLRLRREVAELAMERDVLKRSVVLWVKEATK